METKPLPATEEEYVQADPMYRAHRKHADECLERAARWAVGSKRRAGWEAKMRRAAALAEARAEILKDRYRNGGKPKSPPRLFIHGTGEEIRFFGYLEQAKAASPDGLVWWCQRCGHLAGKPERHNAIMSLECPGGADCFVNVVEKRS